MIESLPIVYIVDDDEPMRAYCNAVLTAHEVTCRLLESAQAFLDEYDAQQPGCLLLDVRMPGMNGLELQQELNVRGDTIPVIFLSGVAEIPVAVAALQQGAFSFLQKPVGYHDLVAEVRKALQYDAANRSDLRERERVGQRFAALTPRERAVLLRLVEGESNKLMATRLQLSQRTIEVYRARVMQKTGARSLAQLVRMAMELQVIPAHERPRTGAPD